MTLPVMEPDLPLGMASILEAWSRTIDEGPYASLCFGERMAFDNPDSATLLGAVAAWTERVRLTTTVVVPQLHHPVLLAKSLATADQLSGGRLSVGIGVGGREEDYRAVDADLATQTIAGMAGAVETMRRVWAGERVTDAVRPVGPPPLQPGGPEILVGTMGKKTIRSAARWADGVAGVTLNADVDEVDGLFRLAREAWGSEGREAPRLTTSFWFAVGDDPRGQVHRHLRHYMNWLPVELVDALAATAGFAGTPTELRDALKRFEDIGCDEVHLIPTSSDLTQVERIAEIL
ncbi:LLM class flavin-dependent oxidoreductase [Nocardioides humilatus]|uniref:LLM class flavin-dependent oxidoreductase n=2 Tax=Nocardioides humilatus TaxID=2607660 RepID=A0A5B1LHK9_9ACTN|nr:LLM class flavin-dependent oxidoreductase [Nocardioides humilatus]